MYIVTISRKLHHLPGSSEPVLMSMEHCEVVSSSALDFIPEDVTDSFDDAQARTEVFSKIPESLLTS